MAKLKLTSPWVDYYYKVNAMFKKDDHVHVIFDDESYELKIYVDDQTKAEAIQKLLPETKEFGNVTLKIKEFGNVTLKISVIPGNGEVGTLYGEYMRTHPALTETEKLFTSAFLNNPVFEFAHTVSGILTNDIVYVVFANEVVQYFNDDLGDYYGQCSTLYQNIAADIFEPIDGVHYCTEKKRCDLCEC